ncbi:MG2 domain-containing protein [Novipirellula artificiosorum]|uniref:MG2 domain protein n=1 Tax=Novipirellula artificiosorum TaxID=2528016 RepID=A0A5C6DY07_9BACT|nr:MG2 domain-containing protein [Novipirellula artificiosorum]TWU41134.1 MG2 domain protein [Novipirellula artificiosorum]
MNPKQPSRPNELRQTLLELHYDLLDPEEANELRGQIASDPEVASAWAETLRLASKIADAAKAPGPVVAATLPPDEVAGEVVTGKSPKGVWIGPTVAAALAASIGMMVLGASYLRRVPENPVAAVRIEANVAPSKDVSVDNQFEILTTKLDARGSSIGGFAVTPASLSFSVLARGTVLFAGRAETDQTGAGRIVLPPELVIPEEAKLTVTASSGVANVTPSTIEVPLEPTRCLTYITTDRPVYRPGETVFFRSLTLERKSFRAKVDVPIRYEIIDPSGSMVAGLATEGVTDGGVGNGALSIPSTAPGGPYTLVAKSLDGFFPEERCEFQVRAYRVPRFKTQLEFDRRSYGAGEMVNADLIAERAEGGPVAGGTVRVTATVDDRVIHSQTTTMTDQGTCSISFPLPTHLNQGKGQLSVSIDDGGTQETRTKTIPIQTGLVAVEFYPEGGYLVGGLQNRVYFVARNALGKPIHLAGEIQTRDGQRVTEIETERDGMGRFQFVPQRGERYSLKVTAPVDITNSPKLPVVAKDLPVLDTGVGVFGADEPITMTIRSDQPRPVVVRAVCRGQLVGERSLELHPATPSITLPIRKNASGVIRVTVLDSARKPAVPLVERLVFRRQTEQLHVVIAEESLPLQRSPGEPLRLNLEVRDETGEPTAAMLGVAVVDDASLSLSEAEQPSMRTHFLLTSEVQKPEDLEHANFYLADLPEAAEAVDLLLGTQGWRRFVSGTGNVPNVDFREQLVRLLQLDGPESARQTQTFQSSNEHAYEWSKYRETVASAWRALVLQTRLLLSAIFVIWLITIAIRMRRRRRWEMASWMLVAATSLVIYGCGAPVNSTVEMASDAEMAMPERSGAVTNAAIERPEALDPESLGPEAIEPGPNTGQDRVLSLDEFGEFDDQGKRLLRTATQDLPARSLTQADLEKLLAARGIDAEAMADQLIDELRFPVRQYAHQHPSDREAARNDFTETLYWNPLLITDSEGRATMRFDLSDSVTTFRVSVDAHASGGRIGSLRGEIQSRLPFQVEPKMPLEVTAGDRIDLPVALINATDSPTEVTLSLKSDSVLQRSDEAMEDRTVSLLASERKREVFSLHVANDAAAQDAAIEIRAAGDAVSDSIRRTVHVSPSGYPQTQSFAGRLDGRTTVLLPLPDEIVAGSLSVTVRAYPSPVAEVISGIDSLLREPHGCFEQASATNYPNTMVLRYMQESESVNAEVSRRAMGMLDRGYEKLTQFECAQRGYEWFGDDPGHEALSAFGLMQFADMAKVMEVSEEMVARTRTWLMGRRDGAGGFKRNPRHLHEWSVQQPIVNAYVLWAISEADVASGQPHRTASDLASELDQLNQFAQQSNDPYLIGLSAATLMNVKRTRDAEVLLEKLTPLQNPDGSLQGQTTVVSSRGLSLTMESTAIAVIAWAKHSGFGERVQAAVGWIRDHRTGDGGFGSTQATVLALKALVAAGNQTPTHLGGGELKVMMDGHVIGRAAIPDQTSGAAVEIVGLGKIVGHGTDVRSSKPRRPVPVTLVADNGNALSYSIDVSYHVSTPSSEDACPLHLTTRLSKESQDVDRIAAGQTLSMEAELVNLTGEGLPMTVAILGVPAGLEPRTAHLDELNAAGQFDYYELRGREVVLYWRMMKPNETKSIRFDVTAEIPGSYTGPASRAYLYYTSEQKQWDLPLKLQIQ